MGITKPVEDLVPRRKFTHPNPKAGTQVSANHGYSNTCKNIYLLLNAYLACAETEVMLGSFHCGLWDLWSQHRERRGRMETRKEEQKESGERQEQTNKTNLVKPSAGLGPGLKCVCVCMWGDVNRVAGIRTDPGLSNSQLADDPILERSAAHQPPWDPRMRACICVCECVCLCLCVQACGFDWCACQCAHLQACSCTNKCVCVWCVSVYIRMCLSEKESRAIRNQTEAVCASCPLFEGGLWSFGPREEDRMKDGVEQVA